MQARRTLITLLAWTSLLCACTPGKEAVVAADAPGIRAIYDAHMHRSGHDDLQALRESVQENPVQALAAVDPGGNPGAVLKARFAKVANPELIMYVYPHLAGPEHVPVPGYFTAFPMYARIHYARPGEVAGAHTP